MTRPPDRVEMYTGIYNLPAEIREVARLANAAGLEGFRTADVTIGTDHEDALKGQWHTYITITYQEKPDAT